MKKLAKSQLQKDYFWNTLGSSINAAASVVLLMTVTQLVGAYFGGVFALAYAVAQQFQSLGQYEMRPYQATDAQEQYSFGTYYASRILTSTFMLIGILAYALYTNGASFEAALIVLIGCMKWFDAFEDVFHGMLQQHGKLNLAGKALFFRVLITMTSFVVALFITRDMLIAAATSIAFSLVSMIALNIPVSRTFVSLKPDFSFLPLKKLLTACFPLFLGSFLLLYIYNVPKYGIENFFSKEYQTYYAILFMPAMVINLFSGFAFKPLLATLAVAWVNHDAKRFREILFKGVLVVSGVTAFIVALAYPFGIPVLSWLYGVNLEGFHTELMFLLLGGCFTAGSIILYYGLTVMRKQNFILISYSLVALIAFFTSDTLVRQFGIMGAASLFTCLMMLLLILFAGFIIFFIKKRTEHDTENDCPRR